MSDTTVEYFKLPRDFGDRFKVARLKDEGFDPDRVDSWYAHLHDMSKFGKDFVFRTSLRRWARHRGYALPPVTNESWVRDEIALWEAFERAGIIEIVDGELADLSDGFKVFVVEAQEIQASRASRSVTSAEPLSPAERARRYRSRKKVESAGEVTKRHGDRHVTPTDRQTELDKQTNRQTDSDGSVTAAADLNLVLSEQADKELGRLLPAIADLDSGTEAVVRQAVVKHGVPADAIAELRREVASKHDLRSPAGFVVSWLQRWQEKAAPVDPMVEYNRIVEEGRAKLVAAGSQGAA